MLVCMADVSYYAIKLVCDADSSCCEDNGHFLDPLPCPECCVHSKYMDKQLSSEKQPASLIPMTASQGGMSVPFKLMKTLRSGRLRDLPKVIKPVCERVESET